jgi:hypothetical protein
MTDYGTSRKWCDLELKAAMCCITDIAGNHWPSNTNKSGSDVRVIRLRAAESKDNAASTCSPTTSPE